MNRLRWCKIITSDIFFFCLITGVALINSVYFALGSFHIDSDSLLEYNTFLYYLKIGRWEPLDDNMLSTSLITTYFPSIVARIFNWVSPEDIYRIAVGVVSAFLPPAMYLLLRKYTTKPMSLVLTFFLYTSFYYQHLAMGARMLAGVAAGTLLFYAMHLENKRLKYSFISIAALVMVISHYSVAYMWLYTVGLLVLFMGVIWLLRRHTIPLWREFAVVFIVLLLGAGILYPLSGAPVRYASYGFDRVAKEMGVSIRLSMVVPNFTAGIAEPSFVPEIFGAASAQTEAPGEIEYISSGRPQRWRNLRMADLGILLARFLLGLRAALLILVVVALTRRGLFLRAETMGLVLFIVITLFSIWSQIVGFSMGSLRPSFILAPFEFSAVALWLGPKRSSYLMAPPIISLSLFYH